MTIKSCIALIILITSFSAEANNFTSQNQLKLHGYIRSGLGMSEYGKTQTKFALPGTRASYRLGNEPDTNIELQFTSNHKPGDNKPDNLSIESVFMIDGYKQHGESNDFTLNHLAQGYLSFNRFFNNEITLWIGRRYYERKSIHILDHTWLNPGQGAHAGVGIENISANIIGTSKLNFAVFRYEDNLAIGNTSYLLNSTNLDVRWHGLQLSKNASLTVWATLSTRHNLAALNYATQPGYGVGSWLDYSTSKISNTSALVYQSGSAIPQGDYNGKPIREIDGWNLESASSLEMSNTLTYEHLPRYSLQWTMLFRQEDHGMTNNSMIDWYSTGIRPIYYFSRHINIAFETGVDYVNDKANDRHGTLMKLTSALQISANRGFYERPVLRFFLTVAEWSDEYKGLIGNSPGDAPFGSKTHGWSIGVQSEAWW